jgi:XTP/dITP diphosphohydrolase
MFHLLLATRNQGKVHEIRQLLKDEYIKLSSLSDFPEYVSIDVAETGATFIENAQQKSQVYGRLTGLPTLADDSGLVIDALDGKPGVLSARYASTDQQRIQKVLNELQAVPASQRTARFICVFDLYDPSSDKHYPTQGIAEGFISTQPQGNRGFGYDPIFICNELGKTFADAKTEEKNQVSHRAKAWQTMQKIIRKRCR